ncbi:MAG: riboflavin kinase [Anaerolineae bacterium]
MWTTADLETLFLPGPTSLTIGAFDGVHRGHQALIRRLVESARAAGRHSVVVTFDPLPLQYFGRAEEVLLSSVEERVAYLRPLGVDGVVVLPFDAAMANTTAADFVTLMLQHLHMVELWVGPDFALGRGREGNARRLRQMGKKRGFTVHQMPPFRWRDEVVHSTRIRELLRAGNVQLANALLGRPYRLTGALAERNHREYAAGVPTLIFRPPAARLQPGPGVYVGQIQWEAERHETLVYIRRLPSERKEMLLQPLYGSKALRGCGARLDLLAHLRPLALPTSFPANLVRLREDRRAAQRWLEQRALPLARGTSGEAAVKTGSEEDR